MYISQVNVINYRLLKKFSLPVNPDSSFSMCIGRNNSGKTSLLNILEDTLRNRMQGMDYYDFSVGIRKQICDILEKKTLKDTDAEMLKNNLSIKLVLRVDYSDPESDLSLIPMLSLEEEVQYVDIEFVKYFDPQKHKALRAEYTKNIKSYENIATFLEKRGKQFLTTTCFASDANHDGTPGKGEKIEGTVYGDGAFFGMLDKIKLHTIPARRNVANAISGRRQHSTLSKYMQDYLGEDESSVELQSMNALISDTDRSLTEEYNKEGDGIFSQVKGDIEKFIPGLNENNLRIRSMIGRDSILGFSNTQIFYGDDTESLPEDYSGLGYMNMYAMIIKLRTILNEIEKDQDKRIADILFIEEPEAHTHPQMQYVFANKIKEFLETEASDTLQTFITTHSSHIVSQFKHEDDIVYLVRGEESVEARCFVDFYAGKYKNFLRQYLTVHRAELFFADKIIFVEGDTERVLLPYFMSLMDNEKGATHKPLLSQYISLVDVGSSAHIFSNFLNMLNIPTLIITDIDSCKKTKHKKARIRACNVIKGELSSNPCLGDMFGARDLKTLIETDEDGKIFSLDKGVFKKDAGGLIRVAYQLKEGSYYPRSFEDSFLSLNKQFVVDNRGSLKESTLYTKLHDDMVVDFRFAEYCIKSKAKFAIDMINLDINEELIIPAYIREGLLWIANR